MNSQNKASDESGNLLSLAAHEIRTPLSVIKWYTEMLLDGDCGNLNDDQTKYLKTIQTSNQRAIDLIKSLLNISRLDLGTFSIKPEEIDLRFLVKQVLTEFKNQIEEKSIVVSESYEGISSGVVVPLMLDKQISLVILRNLISNAISFSEKEGLLEIRIKDIKQHEEYGTRQVSDDSLVISITDTGIGIPESDKENIFSKLFKASNVTTGESSGAGLGLYILKRILDTTGGDIWFTSTQNVGSTFYVAFPKHGMPKKDGKTILD